MKRPFRRFSIVFLVLPLITIGCGEDAPPTGTASGTVTVGGKPAPESISLTLLDLETGQGTSVAIGPEGKFEIAKPIRVGTYNAFFTPSAPPPAEGAEPAPVTPVPATIPEKYHNETTTDVKVEIKEGSNPDLTVEFPT